MKSLAAIAAIIATMAGPALAERVPAGPTGVSATISSTSPEVNTTVTFTAAATGITGVMSVSWDFGDGSLPTSFSQTLTATHVYTTPGHFTVILRAQDNSGSAPNVPTRLIAHYHVPAVLPRNSSTLILDAANRRLWVVNPDQDTVAVLDATNYSTGAYLTEVQVGKNPRTLAQAADGRIWVVSQQHPSISVINPTTYVLEHVVPLPHGSLPYGICMSTDGASAYVTFQGSGGVAMIDVASRSIVATNPAPPAARGVSVASNGHVFVTRFLSPQSNSLLPYNDPAFLTANRGEVVEFTGSLGLVRTINMAMTPQSNVGDPDFGTDTETTAKNSRGVPNYLTSMVISPDGRRAWVPSKKDNIQRGTATLRDGLTPGAETTYRAIVSSIDLTTTAKTTDEITERIDVDNSEMPQAACISPMGDYLFVALQGNNRVQIRDLYLPASTNLLNGLGENTGAGPATPDGLSPQGLVVDTTGVKPKLWVQNYMGRSITLFDITSVLDGSNPSLLGLPPVVISTVVGPDALGTGPASPFRGKQVFYNATDPKMSSNGYISCAGCHLDGGSDMRVFDFTNRGEGLRNTIMLQGRGGGAGPKHGNVHWSANFDEIQDFDNDVYFRFHDGNPNPPNNTANTSFTTNPNAPMGVSNALRSNDLDAMAAYVNSLQKVSRSPFRNADGSLTASGKRGELLFTQQQCAQCHKGREFTDSVIFTDPVLTHYPPSLHNVGTLTSASGSRLGQPLPGIDTPTLKGVWQTAPYFHDGSAATIEDVIARVPNTVATAHGSMHLLSASDQADLAEYLKEIDELDAPPVFPAQVNTVTITSVSTGRPYSLATASTGSLPFVDRSYTIATNLAGLPNENGQILLRTAEDDKGDASANLVTINIAGTTADVYVFFDSRATSLPTWLQAYTAVPTDTINLTPGTSVTGLPMLAYKLAAVNGAVTLGGTLQGNATGALRNWFAIIKPVSKVFEEGPISQGEWAHDQDQDGDGLRDEVELSLILNPWVANSASAVLPDEDALVSGGTQTAFQAQAAMSAAGPGGGGGGGGGCGLMGLEYVLPLVVVRLLGRRRRR